MAKTTITDTEDKSVDTKDTKKKKTDAKSASNTAPQQSATAQTATAVDPDVAKLRSLPQQEQLWFFIDDVVPTDKTDTEVTIIENGVTDPGFPMLTLAPKSLEIFEEIANTPQDAAQYYPTMVKYFADIKRLYDIIIRQDINPYWSTELVQPATPMTIQMLLGIQQGACRGFLSLEPKPDSIPFRLMFGELSHKHDFVGIVYLYVK